MIVGLESGVDGELTHLRLGDGVEDAPRGEDSDPVARQAKACA